MFELTGKKTLVIGLARTGLTTSFFCARHGAIVTATDTRSESELGEASTKLRAAGVSVQLGGYTDKILDGQELVLFPSAQKLARPQNIADCSRCSAQNKLRCLTSMAGLHLLQMVNVN